MLPATQRLEAFNVPRLIQQKSYFVVHAPRQTGKTTAMLALARELTASGDYISVLLSLGVGAPFPSRPDRAERAVVDSWKSAIRVQLLSDLYPPKWMPEAQSGNIIAAFLSE